MKVKGIKNAYSATRSREAGAGVDSYYASLTPRPLTRGHRPLIVLLLLIALAISTTAAPVKAVALEEQGAKESSNKTFREGMKAIRSGKYEDAISLYRKILDADKNNVRARLGAALAHLKNRSYRLCFEEASEAIKSDPNSARAHALAGLALLRSGYINHAVKEVNEAFKLNSKEPMAYWAAAEIDYYEGRPDNARVKSYHAHLLDGDEPDYIITFARASSQMEMFKDAADAYELFLRIAPENDKDRRDAIKGLIQFYRQLGGVNVHQISGAAVAEVPFRLGSDRRPYIKVKVNGRDAIFVIDTGSGFTVISKDAAKRLGVSEIAHGGKSQAFGGDGKFQIVYGLIKSLDLGETKVKSVPCYIQHLHYAENAPTNEKADGYIGLSVLMHFLTQLDYKENIMRLDRNVEGAGSAVAALPEATIIPFRRTQNGLISIETEFNGNQRINAILDSGASSTVVSAAAVERFNLRDHIIKGQTAQVFGAAGVTNGVELLFLRHCRVADLQQSNIRALVLNFDAINETTGFEQSGILGGDFMRNFRVTIDFSRAVLAFQPNVEGRSKVVTQPDSQ
jgi:tetratricopeptide (TPR) repeat protein